MVGNCVNILKTKSFYRNQFLTIARSVAPDLATNIFKTWAVNMIKKVLLESLTRSAHLIFLKQHNLTRQAQNTRS